MFGDFNQSNNDHLLSRQGPQREPSPETCGCASPKYLDVLAGLWRHLVDDSACVPLNDTRPIGVSTHSDTAARTVTWPLARS